MLVGMTVAGGDIVGSGVFVRAGIGVFVGASVGVSVGMFVGV